MTDVEASAFWVVAPGRGEIRSETLRAPLAGEAEVRTLYSAISRGTEALVFAGRVPVSERQRMRAPFQDGEFPVPVKYGYANVGRVVRGPSDWLDATVFSLYPHQTRFVVPVAALHRLPANVPAGRAVLAANMETAINALWDAGVTVGTRISIVGAGVVGCLIGWLAARMPGADVELIDIEPSRAAVAEQLSVGFAVPDRARGAAEVVFHTSATSTGLALALRLASFEATVVEISWYGDQEVSVPLGAEFHSQRLMLKSSQVGHVASRQRPDWDVRRRMALALHLLSAPELDVLIDGDLPFASLPATMPAIAAGAGRPLCRRVVYPN